MSSFDFDITDLPSHLALVDRKLKDVAPVHIKGARRLLQASGKRLRPQLVITIAHYSGKTIDDVVLRAATAVELVHIATLVHDDIMDDGTLRWGKPTIHSQEGLDAAILTGDYLLAQGCVLAATVSQEAASLLAETIAALCEGQAIELEDVRNVERSIASLIAAASGKTSSLFIAACRLGGMTAHLDPAQIEVLATFAENFGIAYQFMDDIADFVMPVESAGKSVGNDIREGVYTLPILLSLQGPHRAALKKLLTAKTISTAQIIAILGQDSSIQRAQEQVDEYKQKAIRELEKLDNREFAQALTSFVERSLTL